MLIRCVSLEGVTRLRFSSGPSGSRSGKDSKREEAGTNVILSAKFEFVRTI